MRRSQASPDRAPVSQAVDRCVLARQAWEERRSAVNGKTGPGGGMVARSIYDPVPSKGLSMDRSSTVSP